MSTYNLDLEFLNFKNKSIKPPDLNIISDLKILTGMTEFNLNQPRSLIAYKNIIINVT